MVDLVRARPCDAACCRAAPLRPALTEMGKDCAFRDPQLPDRGCRILAGEISLEVLTPKERARYDDACLNWPQNATRATQKSFGECCWRFVDGTR